MTSFDPALEAVLAGRSLGILATTRRNGRPQLSTVMYHYSPENRLARVSVTAGRAKTKNLQRDPRAALHVTGDTAWQYVVADADAELTPPTDGQDATADALVDLYRSVAGEHPDWADFRAAMAREHRLVLRLHVTHLYGMAG